MGNNNKNIANDNLFIWLSHPKIAAILAGKPLWNKNDKKHTINYSLNSRSKAVPVKLPEITEAEVRELALDNEQRFEGLLSIVEDEPKIHNLSVIAGEYIEGKGFVTDAAESLRRILKSSCKRRNTRFILQKLFARDRLIDKKKCPKNRIDDLYKNLISIILDVINKYLFFGGNKLNADFSSDVPEFYMTRLTPTDYVSGKYDKIFSELDNNCSICAKKSECKNKSACEEKLACYGLSAADNFKKKPENHFMDFYDFFNISPGDICEALEITNQKGIFTKAKFFDNIETRRKLHTYLNSRFFNNGYFLLDRIKFSKLFEKAISTLKTGNVRSLEIGMVADILGMSHSSLSKLKNNGVTNRNDNADISEQQRILTTLLRLFQDEFGVPYEEEKFDEIHQEIIDKFKGRPVDVEWYDVILENFANSVDYIFNFLEIDCNDEEAHVSPRLDGYDLYMLAHDNNYIQDYEERYFILCTLISDTDFFEDMVEIGFEPYICNNCTFSSDCDACFAAFEQIKSFIEKVSNNDAEDLESCDAPDSDESDLWYYTSQQCRYDLYTPFEGVPQDEIYELSLSETKDIKKEHHSFAAEFNRLPVELKRLVMTFPYAFAEDISPIAFEGFIEKNKELYSMIGEKVPYHFMKKILEMSEGSRYSMLKEVKKDIAATPAKLHDPYSDRRILDILAIISRLTYDCRTIDDAINSCEKINSIIRYDKGNESLFRFDMLYSDAMILSREKYHIMDAIKTKIKFTKEDWMLWLELRKCIICRSELKETLRYLQKQKDRSDDKEYI